MRYFFPIAILCFGCSANLGDFCFQDKDCTGGLRCSARPESGERGVCVYPAGIVDAAVDTLPDALESDATLDAASDTPLDTQTPDIAPDLDAILDTNVVDAIDMLEDD
ncbi:MAG: hypothetical protein V1754_12500 [Pseudomonadota bacterium]